MYKKIYIFLLLKYHYFLFNIDNGSIEFPSNVFFISSINQNTINQVDIKNLYSLKQTNIENLNFTGNIFVIGNEEVQTNISFNNVPTISTATDYLMIDPSIMQVYIGNESSPEPPTPDIITIPDLVTDQIISGDNGLYINNINSLTKIGNKNGIINLNGNEIIFNGPLESKSLFIHFNSPIVFKSHVNKVESMSATVLFCTTGIDKIYFSKLSINNPINTSKNKISFGKSGTLSGTVFNETMTINQNLNTAFGSSTNNQISILNIPNYSDNQKNINYLTVNKKNNILKANITPQNIKQSKLSIDNNFLISEINLNQNQSVHFPITVFNQSSEISINKASCNNFWYGSLYIKQEKLNVDECNINNFLIIYLMPGTRNFSFIADNDYKNSFNIGNIINIDQNILFNNIIFFKLSQNNNNSNKIGYDIINNKLVKITSQIHSTFNYNKNNFYHLQSESSESNELENKIKKLEIIYQKLLILQNEMEPS